jgi:cytochrome d ubiquinol oxidase subunit II
MLGIYVTGFQWNWANQLFALIAALGVSVAYSYIGATWLVLKTEADLQRRAVQWARSAGRITFLGVVSVCLTNLWVNPHVFDRWLQMPLAMFVLLIPMLCFLALLGNDMLLKRLPKAGDRHCGVPFALVILVFVCCFSGLAFSFFPEVVPGQMTIWEAASAAESLQFILIGALVVIPAILLYTAFSYWVFRGKTTELHYH